MAGKSAETIVREVKQHIQDQNGPRSTWYVGITQDIQQRLHGDHRVPGKDHWYITRRASSSSDARESEKSLIKWGCDGGPGGGDGDATYLYAYLKKAGVTDP
jgi:hypothetical protein